MQDERATGRAVPAILEALARDGAAQVRRNAAWALQAHPTCTAGRGLEAALRDPVSEVRQSAAESLRVIAGESPRERSRWLRELCTDSNSPQ